MLTFQKFHKPIIYRAFSRSSLSKEARSIVKGTPFNITGELNKKILLYKPPGFFQRIFLPSMRLQMNDCEHIVAGLMELMNLISSGVKPESILNKKEYGNLVSQIDPLLLSEIVESQRKENVGVYYPELSCNGGNFPKYSKIEQHKFF